MSDEALDLSSDVMSTNNLSSVSSKCEEENSKDLKLFNSVGMDGGAGNMIGNSPVLDQVSAAAILQSLLLEGGPSPRGHQLLASLLAPSGSVLSPWLSSKTALGSILQQLPPPSSSLVSFSALHSLYASIHTTCLSLDKLLEQYFLLFVSALLKTAPPPLPTTMLMIVSRGTISHFSRKPFIDRHNAAPEIAAMSVPTAAVLPLSSTTSTSSSTATQTKIESTVPLGGTNNNSTSRHQHHSKTYGTTFKRKKSTQNGPGSGTSKKSNFRGTSEAENEIDTGFQPREINRDILLCEEYPGVHLDRDVYSTLTSKAPRSATRLIRLLMKHFFSQDTLARSSLSGEGIYKDRLQPEVIEAIKLFIKRRHPKLKNGSINLCMTDVCVQARRVNKNQRTRVTVAGSSGGSGGAASFSGAGSGSSGVQPPPLVLAISDSNNNELCQPVLKMEATDRDEDIDDEDEDEGMEEEEVTTIVKEENEGLDVRKMPAATSCAGSSDSHSLCSSSHIGSTSSSSNQSSPFLTHSHLVSQHHHKSLLHSGSSNRPPRFESLSVVAD